MKVDPYNHEEKYKKWQTIVKISGVPDASKENSDLILQYLDYMEHGLNVSIASVKGGRSYIRLNQVIVLYTNTYIHTNLNLYMINFDTIFENIITEVILVILNFLVFIFLPNVFKKKEEKFKYDPLLIAIGLEVISIANFILNMSFWENESLNILFILTSLGLGYAIVHIYNNQCPNCKKFIKAKNKIDEKVIKPYTKKIFYQPLKITKYSNGKTKKEEPFGKRRPRIEKWERKKEFYKCNFCEHPWDSGQIEVPIFIEKEAHKIINTRERDPEEPAY